MVALVAFRLTVPGVSSTSRTFQLFTRAQDAVAWQEQIDNCRFQPATRKKTIGRSKRQNIKEYKEIWFLKDCASRDTLSVNMAFEEERRIVCAKLLGIVSCILIMILL